MRLTKIKKSMLSINITNLSLIIKSHNSALTFDWFER